MKQHRTVVANPRMSESMAMVLFDPSPFPLVFQNHGLNSNMTRTFHHGSKHISNCLL